MMFGQEHGLRRDGTTRVGVELASLVVTCTTSLSSRCECQPVWFARCDETMQRWYRLVVPSTSSMPSYTAWLLVGMKRLSGDASAPPAQVDGCVKHEVRPRPLADSVHHD